MHKAYRKAAWRDRFIARIRERAGDDWAPGILESMAHEACRDLDDSPEDAADDEVDAMRE